MNQIFTFVQKKLIYIFYFIILNLFIVWPLIFLYGISQITSLWLLNCKELNLPKQKMFQCS